MSKRFQDHLERNMTTPLVNVISYNSPHFKRWEKEYKELCHRARGALRGDRDLVEFHKKALGRHKGCFTGEFRHWVWEGDGWRVFVSNLKGIGFEVAQHLKPTEALAAWADYRSKVLKPSNVVTTAPAPPIDLTGLKVVRLYDMFDGWIDIAGPFSEEEAQRVLAEKTENGTKNTKYGDGDYYRVFDADTRMVYTPEALGR